MKKYTTQIAAGSLLIVCLAIICCHKNNAAPYIVPPATITDTSIYIDITINNTRTIGIEIANRKSGTNWSQLWGGYFPTGDSSAYSGNRLYTAFLQDSLAPAAFYFSKGNHVLGPSGVLQRPLPAASFLDSFFAAANYAYAAKANDTSYQLPPNTIGGSIKQHLLTDGITIAWRDPAGKLWTSFNGLADQTGSFFTIAKNELIKPAGYGPLTAVTAKFDCKLYDNSGHVLHITNGRFRQFVYFFG